LGVAKGGDFWDSPGLPIGVSDVDLSALIWSDVFVFATV
jgi:hypothetical protein